MTLVSGDAAVMLGEGVRLFEVQMPESLAGLRLSETGIGSSTGLSVVAIGEGGAQNTQLTVDTVMPRDGTLLMLGIASQRQRFSEAFE